MCTFNNDLEMPKFSKSSGNQFKAPITMFLKPGDYRFRLLKYTIADKNDRDYPFIERHVHDHWSVNDKGYKLPDDTVVCLKTKYIPHHGNRKNDCPMCRAADEAMREWSSSRFKDPVSGARFNAMKSKFQGIIPVYVIEDPNNKKNEGHMKCFMFTEKKVDRTSAKFHPELNNPNYILCYDEFVAAINAKINEIMTSGGGYSIWNSKNAVDLVIRVAEVPIVYNRGKSNEYTYNRKVITKMVFTKTPYDIEKIDKSAIDNFEFDDQYYVKNSVDDIMSFYKRNYASAVPNVPDEDINLDDDTPETPVNPIEVSNPSPKDEPAKDISMDEFDDMPYMNPSTTLDPLAVDPDNEGMDEVTSDEKLNDMLKEFDNI